LGCGNEEDRQAARIGERRSGLSCESREESRAAGAGRGGARLLLAVVLGVAIVFWPYSARCGLGMSAYLASVLTLVTAGAWASIWTWKHRAAKAHTLSLMLVLWGLVLGAVDVLPRIGYAKPTVGHPVGWMCN
jgi:hypothetical protein